MLGLCETDGSKTSEVSPLPYPHFSFPSRPPCEVACDEGKKKPTRYHECLCGVVCSVFLALIGYLYYSEEPISQIPLEKML